MKAKRLLSLIVITSVTVLINACSPDTQQAEMPTVNDENCKHENIIKLEKSLRENFASQCLRRGGGFTPSPKREW